MQNCTKSLVNRRNFSFGRRKEDSKRGSIALMSLPREDYQDILDDVGYMLQHMDGAKDYMRECLANAQMSGFNFKG